VKSVREVEDQRGRDDDHQDDVSVHASLPAAFPFRSWSWQGQMIS